MVNSQQLAGKPQMSAGMSKRGLSPSGAPQHKREHLCSCHPFGRYTDGGTNPCASGPRVERDQEEHARTTLNVLIP